MAESGRVVHLQRRAVSGFVPGDSYQRIYQTIRISARLQTCRRGRFKNAPLGAAFPRRMRPNGATTTVDLKAMAESDSVEIANRAALSALPFTPPYNVRFLIPAEGPDFCNSGPTH